MRELDGRAVVQGSRGLVDGVHADLVGAEVGREQEGTGWVEDDLVGMRGILLGGGTRLGQLIVEDLERLDVVSERKREGGKGRAATVKRLANRSSLEGRKVGCTY